MKTIIIALVILIGGCSSTNTIVVEVGSDKINFVEPELTPTSAKIKYERKW